ncbi:hypothetical protein KIW84_023607 [Lathyrus oleraceus]|uniref:t-SNARE coiled-coil homology domain-containing protein n=1 Tax=Pisum sativum TaxID=3888 RepID=A0A9D5BC03_PEA|nr:hypothetical protein KIW84_023607 [Pisum sativum]
MVSQNEILQNLDKRVDKIAEKIDETNEYLKVLSQKMQKHYRSLKAQVSHLDRDLRKVLGERTFGKTFDQKEREIRSLMIGTMKEWHHNLGTFKQDELHRLETTTNILGVLHREFIGDMDIFDRKNGQEFFEMKSCSLETNNLDKHYHRMVHRYYVLNGYNDPSLKNTYVSSLPQEL